MTEKYGADNDEITLQRLDLARGVDNSTCNTGKKANEVKRIRDRLCLLRLIYYVQKAKIIARSFGHFFNILLIKNEQKMKMGSTIVPNVKKDFPFFANNPDCIYMDSAATTHKPQSVIDAVSTYMSQHNSSIHRGVYASAEYSEDLYWKSKELFSQFINAKPNEIIYTYNATYGFNIVAQSLIISGKITAGDKIMLLITEHHANIVPRQILAQQYDLELVFVQVTDDYGIDRDDFVSHYDDQVAVVSISACSNITGAIYDVQRAKKIIHNDTLLVVDASQLLGKRTINVQEWGCDVMIGTAHKLYAMTGLGMIYIRHSLLRELTPPRGGGGMIQDVTVQGFIPKSNREGREPGTPHIIGAVSLLAAIKYIQSLGIEIVTQHDQRLTDYAIEQYDTYLSDEYVLVGHRNSLERVGIISLAPRTKQNIIRLTETLAADGIAVRTGAHCTHPYLHQLGQGPILRMSMGVYTSFQDVQKTIEKISQVMKG